jgi:hypothetical protein
MTLFDLLLIVVVLASVAGIVRALAQAVSGHLGNASRSLGAVIAGLGIYLTAICIVSLSATPKIQALGEPECSDDWCVTPERAHFRNSVVDVEFRVWSRAKRVTQREYGVRPFLTDERGQRFEIAGSSGPEFDRPIGPDEEFTTVRSYRLPKNAETLDLILRDGIGPGTFVIGSSKSLLHPRTVYRIKPAIGPA